MSAVEQSPLMLATALAENQRTGGSVIPLWWVRPNGRCACGRLSCNSAGKHPIHGDWPNLPAHSQADVAALWETWPEANVGLRTGRRWGRIVLDEDVTGALRDYHRAHGEPVVDSRVIRTGGGGKHLEYAVAADGPPLENSAGKLFPGLDVRADGGMVVAPGSRSYKGAYQVIHPIEVASLPAWVEADIVEHARPAPPLGGGQLGDQPESSGQDHSAWVAAGVEAELAKLRACADAATPGGVGYRGQAWDEACWQVADSLISMANSAWNDYTIERAYADYFATAPRDSGWTDRDVDDKWASTLYRAAGKWRPEPEVRSSELAGYTIDPVTGKLAVGQSSAVVTTAVAVMTPEQVLKEGTDDEREALLAAVRDRFPRVDWPELWTQEAGEDWLLRPLVAQGRNVTIYSPPKAGKSLLMLEMAAALATCRKALGQQPKKATRVLYLDWENVPVADIRPRLEAMGYEPGDLENLVYQSFPPTAKFDTDQGGQELDLIAQAYRADYVVVDTVSRTISGEENSNDTWLAWDRHAGQRLKARGVGFIRLDHSGHAGTHARGGSAKYGDVDATWRLEADPDDPAHIVLALEGSRFKVEDHERVLHLTRREGPLRHDVTEAVAIVTGAVDRIVRDLEEGGVGKDATLEDCMKHLKGAGKGGSKRDVQRAQKQRNEAVTAWTAGPSALPDWMREDD